MSDNIDHIFISTKDFDQSLSFYQDTLKLTVVSSWGGDGVKRGAVLSRGNFSVVIAEPHEAPADHAALGFRAHVPTIHLNVADLDARFAEITHGSHIKIQPESTHWGTRWFVVEDPDENLIAFTSQVKS